MRWNLRMWWHTLLWWRSMHVFLIGLMSHDVWKRTRLAADRLLHLCRLMRNWLTLYNWGPLPRLKWMWRNFGMWWFTLLWWRSMHVFLRNLVRPLVWRRMGFATDRTLHMCTIMRDRLPIYRWIPLSGYKQMRSSRRMWKRLLFWRRCMHVLLIGKLQKRMPRRIKSVTFSVMHLCWPVWNWFTLYKWGSLSRKATMWRWNTIPGQWNRIMFLFQLRRLLYHVPGWWRFHSDRDVCMRATKLDRCPLWIKARRWWKIQSRIYWWICKRLFWRYYWFWFSARKLSRWNGWILATVADSIFWRMDSRTRNAPW
jgi:hypothetical protein